MQQAKGIARIVPAGTSLMLKPTAGGGWLGASESQWHGMDAEGE